jgi:Tol biopolymer transport system component
VYSNTWSDSSALVHHWSTSIVSPAGIAFDGIRQGDGYPLGFSGSGSRLIVLEPYPSLTPAARLYLVDLPTGEVSEVPLSGVTDPVYMDWAPDDNSITVNLGGDLYLVDLTTGSTRLVLHCQAVDHGACGTPAWSPDRRRIAVNLHFGRSGPADSRTGVYILDADCFLSPAGCPFERWQRVPEREGLCAWSPDSDQIAVAEYFTVSIVDASDLATIREIPLDPPLFAQSLEWSPQTGVLAIASHDQIYLVRADGGSLPSALRSVAGTIGPMAWFADAP